MAVVLSDHQKKKIKQLEGAAAGKGSMKAKVLAFAKENPGMSVNEMSKKLGMNYATVRHAMLTADGKKMPTPVAKATKRGVVPEKERANNKANAVDAFCPKCGKPAAAHICAVTLVGENTYSRSAIGSCVKCKISFSFKVD